MPCDTRTVRQGQTLDQRKTEVRSAVAALSAALVSGRAKAIIDKASGAIAFQGWIEGREAQVSDACAYRYILATGSALAKQMIARAEQLAGRTVNREALRQGVHGHEHGGHMHFYPGH
jgi:hypothetical protein